ncbi:MAG: transposase [Deltaproteobacteria bacterium]|nr:transposase [Deltaproteobacteria bacterium]
MPRITRMVISDQPAVYHIVSRTVLSGYPLGAKEKDFLLKQIKRLSKLYFAEIIGFCLMGDHFHLLVKMFPATDFSESSIRKRCRRHYGDDYTIPKDRLPLIREKLASLSEFVKDVKIHLTRYYNRHYNRRGFFWAERFKSVIVEAGAALVNCLVYIDLNPLRAGIVKKPEDYRWVSIGYHIQTNNKDNFLSTDFGFEEFNARSQKERVRRYRNYMYNAGSIDRPGKVIDPRQLIREKKRGVEITQAGRLRYRNRYFTDSGIIGSEAFVSTHYQRFKHHFTCKHEKKPKPIQGLSGIYSMKRLSELI